MNKRIQSAFALLILVLFGIGIVLYLLGFLDFKWITIAMGSIAVVFFIGVAVNRLRS